MKSIPALSIIMGSLALAGSPSHAQTTTALPATQPPAQQRAPVGAHPTKVYFGDTHVHTAISGDAGGAGTRLMPRDAYRFASGEEVTSNTGQTIKLAQPLDFYMITDHSDGMGAIVDALNGTPNIMADEQGKALHEDFVAGGERAMQAAWRLSELFSSGRLSKALNYQPGNPAYERVWHELVDAAEEFNRPGTFTTFAAYEWTSVSMGGNLHRNVILRDGPDRTRRALPFTTYPPQGSINPRDLWQWMENYESTTGGQAIAIPHNGNVSNGRMVPLQDEFDLDNPLDRAYAERRQKWEPLYEASQYKGDGEAHPYLSPEDEFADFETWDWGNLNLTEAKQPGMLAGEYARSGLLRGLKLERETGANPFKFGMVGATDTHTGLTTVVPGQYFGKFTAYEPSKGRATKRSNSNEKTGLSYDAWRFTSSGLTAVWATNNTREALFDAMKRREAYATTGPRIQLRFFGGTTFTAEDIDALDIAGVGYAKGVPMGSDLVTGAETPVFLVAASKDPLSANLDRIQIVKGWLDASGEMKEKVYDVAWSGSRKPDEQGRLSPVGSTVDLELPGWEDSIGAASLVTVWRDPEFNDAERAFYYVRFLEIPTPRWTAYDRAKYKLDLPDEIPLAVQQRAYSSPIWYTP